MSLCKYQNSLGIPGKGVHFHVFGIAIMDVLFTFLGAWFIQKSLKKSKIDIHYWKVLLALFILGIILHKLFCVETTIHKFIFW